MRTIFGPCRFRFMLIVTDTNLFQQPTIGTHVHTIMATQLYSVKARNP